MYVETILAAQDALVAQANLPAPGGAGAGLPEMTPEQPPFADKFLELGNAATWVAYLACALGLVYAGAKMGYERYTGGAIESPKRMAAVVFGCIVVASAVAIVNWASS